ncbi:hypothetical protein F5Y14DRAFT_462934 [Nemania sp. NC0429]|nr:hypothetical protein F5Y14DRAFT_462934 [Nemania sp. NC0429]
MPYSDNLYSMSDDSDSEDYADQLSPSDGRFPASSSNGTPHIPNVFLPDPTLQQQQQTEEGRAESKAREADEDRLISPQTDSGLRPSAPSSTRPSSRMGLGQGQAATATLASPTRHHHSITHSPSSASQSDTRVSSSRPRSSSLYSEAPPAYSPSPIPPIPSQAAASPQDQPRNYNTFGSDRTMGHPESMGAPTDEEHGLVRVGRVHRYVPRWFGWKRALLALVVLVLSAAFLSGIPFSFRRHREGDDGTAGPSPPIGKDPEARPPDGPDAPSGPQYPGDSDSSGSPFQPPYCDGKLYRYDDQVLALNFVRSQSLTFEENVYKHPGSMSVRVGGQVNVRRLGRGDGDPRMVLEIAANEPKLLLRTSLDADLQEIKVSLPEAYESPVHGQRPCVEIKGTVWVPEGAEISLLSLRAIHLDIRLFDDLHLRVADYAELSSVVGHIQAGASERDGQGAPTIDPHHGFVPAKDSWAFDSRAIEVHTTSGSINGTWPLYDTLGLHTTAGNISVSITPKEALANGQKPAVLSLSSLSGVISAVEPVHNLSQIPRRDYVVDVKSTAGSIHGALAFSTDTTAHITAGALVLDLLPVINTGKITPQKPAQLETKTTSGATSVRILEPLFFGGDDKAVAGRAPRALDCLQATHQSTSGRIGLRYPQAWEGMLYAQTTGGRLVARGRDLKILKHVGGWAGSEMEARKGAAGKKSSIEVHAVLGGMDALIGEE